MDCENLQEDAEYVGEWWLPGSKEKTPGVFQYKEGRLILRLLKPLSDDANAKTVYGSVTGYWTRRDGGCRSGGTRPASRINATMTLAGVRFDHLRLCGTMYAAVCGPELDDDHRVDQLSFGFDMLHTWAVSTHNEDEMDDVDRFEDLTDRLEFGDDDAACELIIFPRETRDAYEGISRSYQSQFIVKPKERMPLEEILERYVGGIRSFLMITMGRNLNLGRMNAGNGNHVFVPKSRKPTSDDDTQDLVGIGDVRKDPKTIGKWLGVYNKNKHLVDEFLKTMSVPYVEHADFFVYASMLEGYSKSISAREQEQSENMALSTPSDDAGAPSEQEARQQRQSYRKRVTKVLKSFENEFDNWQEFVDELVRMRNDVFHVNRQDLDARMIGEITHDLYFLIRMVWLHVAGFCVTADSTQTRIDFKFLKPSSRGNARPAG